MICINYAYVCYITETVDRDTMPVIMIAKGNYTHAHRSRSKLLFPIRELQYYRQNLKTILPRSLLPHLIFFWSIFNQLMRDNTIDEFYEHDSIATELIKLALNLISHSYEAVVC